MRRGFAKLRGCLSFVFVWLCFLYDTHSRLALPLPLRLPRLLPQRHPRQLLHPRRRYPRPRPSLLFRFKGQLFILYQPILGC